jgi:hypothetical protein
MYYWTPEGTMKDNHVIWHDGTFYMVSMYKKDPGFGRQKPFNNMWLAKSKDGVHWESVGCVIEDAPFTIWGMRVWKVKDRFIMNHGSFTGKKSGCAQILGVAGYGTLEIPWRIF